MPSVLITGANRGIGYEFTRQYAEDGWRVYAACRHPERAAELTALADQHETISIHPLDVADTLSVRQLAESLQGTAIDMLINNAGISGSFERQKVGHVDYDDWLRVLDTNILGPTRMVEAFLPHLESGDQKRVVMISSRMGSVGEDTSGNFYAYRSSKAALNMTTRAMAVDLADRAIKFINLHPGWVQTAMGGENADWKPEDTVANMRKTLASLPAETSDVFLDNQGREITW